MTSKLNPSLLDQSLDPLIRDLLEWVAREPRTYTDVLDAWRTSCPRLTVWEDAIERGLLTRTRDNGTAMIAVTESGIRFLAARQRQHIPAAVQAPKRFSIT